jgi:hypothetical protein
MLGLMSFLLAFMGGIVVLRYLNWRTAPSHDTTGCLSVPEALLLGVCLLRSGALESVVYDATLARNTCQKRGASRPASQSSGVEPVAQDAPSVATGIVE